MTDLRAARAALDAAILEYIKAGHNWHPMYAGSCVKIAIHIDNTKPERVIDRRLQALRKARKIEHVGKRMARNDHGWVLVDAS
jgi:hypothetical protein